MKMNYLKAITLLRLFADLRHQLYIQDMTSENFEIIRDARNLFP